MNGFFIIFFALSLLGVGCHWVVELTDKDSRENKTALFLECCTIYTLLIIDIIQAMWM